MPIGSTTGTGGANALDGTTGGTAGLTSGQAKPKASGCSLEPRGDISAPRQAVALAVLSFATLLRQRLKRRS
jgi:hypothetical protein